MEKLKVEDSKEDQKMKIKNVFLILIIFYFLRKKIY